MFYIGCDPEVFLQDAAGGLIASCGLIGGTKEEPRPLPIGDGYSVQEDNVAIEFGIPPAPDKDTFINSVKSVMSHMQQEIAAMGLSYNRSSAASFPVGQLQHPDALVFGCEPDFDAWTGKVNIMPHAVDHTLRSAGGHIHIGLLEAFEYTDIPRLMQLMDFYAGVPACLMDTTGARRRELYGKPGAFRYKPYGGEYRVLSNFWTFEDKYLQWAYDVTAQAVDAWQNKKDVTELKSDIIKVIKGNDLALAKKMVETHNLMVV